MSHRLQGHQRMDQLRSLAITRSPARLKASVALRWILRRLRNLARARRLLLAL